MKTLNKQVLLGCLSGTLALGQVMAAFGGWQAENGSWYWIKEDQTRLMSDWIKDEGGNWYYLEADGRMAVGWKQIGGTWYFLNNGATVNGSNGRPYGAALTGWQWIDGRRYYFQAEGQLLVSAAAPDGLHVNADGEWTDANGVIQTDSSQGYVTGGWQQSSGYWNWIKRDGSRLTNSWLQDEAGNWYYLDGNGNMSLGWLQLGGTWYYLNNVPSTNGVNPLGKPYGAALTGWQWIDGKCYYFQPAGCQMLASATAPDGSLVNGSGQWIDANGNVQIDENKGFTSGGSWKGGSSGGQTSIVVGGGSGGGGGGSSSGGGGGSSSGGGGGSSSGGGGGSSSGGGGGSNSGNTGNETSERDKKVAEEIAAFKNEYIKEGMSDFEKELQIIRYLVETVDYDIETRRSESDAVSRDPYTAYGALVNGLAVCDGYSRAFSDMAEACGLETIRVTGIAGGGAHAWNKIKLDGAWYNVDVTWEDPTIGDSTENGYGFDQLWNRYINLTDEELERDHSPESKNHRDYPATEERYGPTVVAYYQITGTVDSSMFGDKWRKYLMANPEISEELGAADLTLYGQRLEDGSNYFETLEENTAAAYLQEAVKEKGIKGFYLTTQTKERPDWLTKEWLVQQIGGNLEDWVLQTPIENLREDYWVHGLLYMGEDGLDDEAEMRRLFEEACDPDRKNVVATAEEAKAYVTGKLDAELKMADKPKSVTLIYEGAYPQAEAQDLKKWLDYIKNVDESKNTVTVDGRSYVICRYQISYKTREEYLGTYLEKDASNLFEISGTDDLEYLKRKIDEVIEKQETDVVYTVYPAGEERDLTPDLKDYLKTTNANVGVEAFPVDSTELFYEGTEYHVYQYMLNYYGLKETEHPEREMGLKVPATPSSAQRN